MMTKLKSTRVKAPTLNIPVVDASPTGNNEVMVPNPKGRIKADSENKSGKKLISCRKHTLVSFQNVRTLRSKGKRLEITNLMKQQNIKILGIADHKITHEEELLTEEFDNCRLITSSAWRNTTNAAVGGVGILLDKNTEKSMTQVEKINERIIIAQFHGNPMTTIIVHYSPINGSSDAEDHYKKLLDTINLVPKHNILLVLGDYNAHLGTDNAKNTYHTETNTNGQYLADLAEEGNMIIGNTEFQKRKGKLWTYISDMNGHKSQIDYILINKKWKNSLKNVEAYNSFASTGSDHRIITAKIKLSLRMCKTPKRKQNYDWYVLKDDKDLQLIYSIKVQNRYAELCALDESTDATQKYGNLVIANNETAEEMIPAKKLQKRRVESTDPRIVNARNNVNNAFIKYLEDTSEQNQLNLQIEKNTLKMAYEKIFEEDLENSIRKVENADLRAQHKESWKLINKISGRKATKKGKIKANSNEDRVTKWFEYFKQLLGNEPVVTDEDEEIAMVINKLEIDEGPFTIGELEKAKKRLKAGKAAGPDGISSEVIKYCNLDDIILEFANKLADGEIPKQMSEIDIIPLPKSGDLGLTTNYRGIALSAIIAKIINRMVMNRIQPHLEPHLRTNQNGFRPGRSTEAHILALRRIIEGVRRNNLKATLLFVDFKKAFDSIHRSKMLKILVAYGIPEIVTKLIGKMYEETKAKVLSPDGETDLFNIQAGVLQGDTLAPYLFVIVIDYVMRTAIGESTEMGFTIHPRKSRRIPSVNITDLCFADDIALLANEIAQAQELLKRIETEASKVGLVINSKKTEVMNFNQDEDNTIINTINGDNIKTVENFKYLGAWMKSTESDIKIRKALAWSACHKLRTIWSSTLKKSIKIRLFVSTVESVLLYGSSTWTVTKKLEKQIDGVYTRMLRMAQNVSWKEHMTNEELYGSLPKVSEKIRKSRLRIAGHCIRHSEEEAAKVVLWEPRTGRIGRGRRPINYIDILKNDTGLEETNDLKAVMEDRELWKGIVTSARTGVRPK